MEYRLKASTKEVDAREQKSSLVDRGTQDLFLHLINEGIC